MISRFDVKLVAFIVDANGETSSSISTEGARSCADECLIVGHIPGNTSEPPVKPSRSTRSSGAHAPLSREGGMPVVKAPASDRVGSEDVALHLEAVVARKG